MQILRAIARIALYAHLSLHVSSPVGSMGIRSLVPSTHDLREDSSEAPLTQHFNPISEPVHFIGHCLKYW